MSGRYDSASVVSKWTKTKWMIQDPKLSRYIPETRLFGADSLSRMVERYRMVYFKPTTGSGGQGISRIVREDGGTFEVKNNGGTSRAPTVEALRRKLERLAKGRSYLLQQGIYLMKTSGRPFDLRVMLQKTDSGTWENTATFAKIGKAGRVATNYNQGGRISFLNSTLRSAGYSEARIEQATEELRTMGRHTGRCFDRHMKGFRELGLDVAFDMNGRPWILEVNTRPQIYPLRQANRSMYDRILRLGRQYGRKK